MAFQVYINERQNYGVRFIKGHRRIYRISASLCSCIPYR